MKRLRFPSLSVLLLVSFILVLAPLILALGSALYSLEQLTGQSQRVVYQAVSLTQASRMLLERLTAMERSVKQALILEDAALFEHYRKLRQTFVSELQGLAKMSAGEPELRRLLRRLEGDEFDLYAQLSDPKLDRQTKLAVADQLAQLRQLAERIWELSIQLVGRHLQNLEERSRQARQQTMRHLVILLPVALGLVAVFIYLITRPMKQLDAAIRKLGDRDFDQPIVVQGPRDLESLGQRLDWLRLRLRMLEAEKRRFMRNISHELKTPLANVHEGTELLADRVVGDLNTEQEEIVRIIGVNAGRLYRMIEDLIRYSQLQSTETVQKPQQVDMHRLVDDVLEDYRVRLRVNEIQVRKQLESCQLFGFAEQLRSMIDNLLSNAVKYSPRGGVIELKLQRRKGNVIFEIRDQGPGIPPEERERVFDALYQGRLGKRMGIEGTGLGLSIVNECAMIHRGRVEIVDVEGWGACLRVTLPVDGVRI
ncbi:two-component system, NtrC family, sensor histidine kinase GlrK [Methylomarinovum caldicuralii]|uniref:histidine kinase n=1 Tax=Methylomarinovum caldicuralii TaxID=438856 RepID=A0AAU9CKY0_9GAMM|nr:two-component system, NtrC family, sensor histidine kinase GlrK [Methylomarinovum caldicuralii]